MKKNKIENSVESIIESNDLKSISIEVAEKIIDSEITDELLKEVPIVKSIMAIKNIYSSYSDKIFLEKALNVLLELGKIETDDRIRLIVELSDIYSTGSKKILMAIDKIDSIEKCVIFGRLCRLRANGKIDVGDFMRLTKLIQDSYLDELHFITEFKDREPKNITTYHLPNLLQLGLIYQTIKQEESGIKIYHALTNLGDKLLDIYDFLFPDDKKKKEKILSNKIKYG